METSVRVFATIHFIVIGLSHVVQHRAWAEFFIALREKGRAGNFANAFLHLGFGTIIVSFHDVWTGIPLVLTLVGCGQVLKASLYFVFPDYGLKILAPVSVERSRRFIVAGMGQLVLGGLMAYSLVASS